MGSFLFLVIAMFLLLVPIFLQVSLFFDAKNEKIGCVLRLYGVFPLVGGYLTLCKGGVAWHISEKRAKLILRKPKKKKARKKSAVKLFKIQKIKCVWEVDPMYLLPALSIDNVAKLVSLMKKRHFLQSKGALNNEGSVRLFVNVRFRTALWRFIPKLLQKVIGE